MLNFERKSAEYRNRFKIKLLLTLAFTVKSKTESTSFVALAVFTKSFYDSSNLKYTEILREALVLINFFPSHQMYE